MRTLPDVGSSPDSEPGGSPTIALELHRITKTFGRGKGSVQALRGVDQRFSIGTFTAVMGQSGSGKSTMIQCAAGLDTLTSGKVMLGDIELSALKEPKQTITRRAHVGFVFQAFNLLPALDAQQNIELPIKLAGGRVDRDWIEEIISRVGIGDAMRQRPATLSGGQQQRVAIARALAARPRVVFADEPTGALDTRTARAVLGLLRSTVDSLSQTLIMVTHDPVAASYADRVLFLKDGLIVETIVGPTADDIATRLARLDR